VRNAKIKMPLSNSTPDPPWLLNVKNHTPCCQAENFISLLAKLGPFETAFELSKGEISAIQLSFISAHLKHLNLLLSKQNRKSK